MTALVQTPAAVASSAAAHGELAAPAQPAEGGALSLLNFVAQAVSDPNIDVGKLQALLTMQREIIADEAKAQFNQAMAKLQPELPRIKKNGAVWYPVNKNQPDGPKAKAFNYARWEDVDAAIKPILNKHGFSLNFNTRQRTGDGGGVVIIGELLHIGGHSKTVEFALPLDTSGGKSNLQGYASSSSFGARYCAKFLLNLVFEGDDDDGIAGGKSYLNDEMKQRVTQLMRETKTSLEGVLTFTGAESFDEIETGGFVPLVNSMLNKKRKMQQGGEGQP